MARAVIDAVVAEGMTEFMILWLAFFKKLFLPSLLMKLMPMPSMRTKIVCLFPRVRSSMFL